MTTRRYAPITALLAFVLFCLLPATLSARTRRHSAPARAVSAKPHEHVSRKLHTATPSHTSRRSVAVAQHPAKQRHNRHEAQLVPVRSKRNRRETARITQAKTIPPQQKRPIPAPLLVAAHESPDTPEAPKTGVSHPPDLNDTDDPAPASSVVSVIRPSADRPQLPAVTDVASYPEILPSLYNKRGRLIMPPPLKGSREILLHQNEVADRDGLERVQDDADLDSMRRQSMLVALPVNAGMQVDERLPGNRRYCRPWTAQFLATLARAHYARFHTALQVNSAVRTVEFQQRLIRTNGNAAPAEGETASPHLTGQAVDLAKRGLSLSEIAWMRGYLLPLVQEGKIDVEEEFQQSCFHISVYKRYLPAGSTPRRSIATTHREGASALAVAIH